LVLAPVALILLPERNAADTHAFRLRRDFAAPVIIAVVRLTSRIHLRALTLG